MTRIVLFLSVLVLVLPPVALAQNSGPCGVVDSVDFPIDDLVQGYDDFSRYRERFGGNHTGLDIGFDRWGDPVWAVARGRVTYSNPEGWDTEKGVVIIEHLFPDNTIAYSLYGHVEERETVTLPPVGTCVERGQIIATIGWPSRGRPHLHFEWRDFLPNDGGPGYVIGNPLLDGWYNPLDFTAFWRIKLSPAYVTATVFDGVPNVPPLSLENGAYALAAGNLVEYVLPTGEALWRIQTDGAVTGLAALSGDRLFARTETGQTLALQGGRYAAIWAVNGPNTPILTLGERLIFAAENGDLQAYDPAGNVLWTLPGVGDWLWLDVQGETIAAAYQAGSGSIWRLIDANGAVIVEYPLERLIAAVSDPAGGWAALDDGTLKHIDSAGNADLATLNVPAGRLSQLTVDALGSVYVYSGDDLMAFAVDGSPRWQIDYPAPAGEVAPLLAVGGGCLLYSLDADGMLNIFNTADGSLLNQLQLYAGGSRNSSPRARVLRVDAASERVTVGAGFLSLFTLDGRTLAGVTQEACLAG